MVATSAWQVASRPLRAGRAVGQARAAADEPLGNGGGGPGGGGGEGVKDVGAEPRKVQGVMHRLCLYGSAPASSKAAAHASNGRLEEGQVAEAVVEVGVGAALCEEEGDLEGAGGRDSGGAGA